MNDTTTELATLARAREIAATYIARRDALLQMWRRFDDEVPTVAKLAAHRRFTHELGQIAREERAALEELLAVLAGGKIG